jgi:hypothetical protein
VLYGVSYVQELVCRLALRHFGPALSQFYLANVLRFVLEIELVLQPYVCSQH